MNDDDNTYGVVGRDDDLPPEHYSFGFWVGAAIVFLAFCVLLSHG